MKERCRSSAGKGRAAQLRATRLLPVRCTGCFSPIPLTGFPGPCISCAQADQRFQNAEELKNAYSGPGWPTMNGCRLRG
jgi:hypothetical protein